MNGIPGWYRDGGPIMHWILLVALLGLVVLVERFYWIMIRSRANGRDFIERTVKLVHGGKSEDAIRLCAESRAALPDLGLLILRSRIENERDLQAVADAAALSLTPRVTRRLGYLTTLAHVAILLGLVGTVDGLRDALGGMAAAPTTERTARLALGAASALAPLAFGLLVAVPLHVAHAYLANQARTIVEQLEEFSARLINALFDRPDVRLGHR